MAQQDYGGGMYQGIMDVLGPKIERQHALEDEMRKGRIAQITSAIESGNLSPDEIANLEDEITSMYSSPVVKKQMKGALQRLNEYRQRMQNPPPPPPSTTSPIPGATPGQPAPGMTPPPSVTAGAGATAPLEGADIPIPPQKTMEGTIWQGSPLEPPPSIAAAGQASGTTPPDQVAANLAKQRIIPFVPMTPPPSTTAAPTRTDALTSAIVKSQQGLDVESRRRLEVQRAANADITARQVELEKSKEEAAQKREETKAQAKVKQIDAGMAAKGFKWNDEKKDWDPIPEDQLPPDKKVAILKQRAQTELANATEEYRNAQTEALNNPNSLAQQRLQLAKKNYELRQNQYNASYMGVGAQNEPLSGAPIDPATGKPIGFHYARFYGPTAATLSAAQMADPVIKIGRDIQGIASEPNNADLFGPASGRLAELERYFGTDDPRISNLRAKMVGFASLLVSLHRFRSQKAAEEFLDTERVTYGPEAFAAAIQAHIDTASAVKEGMEQARTGGKTPPSTTKPSNPYRK